MDNLPLILFIWSIANLYFTVVLYVNYKRLAKNEHDVRFWIRLMARANRDRQ